MSDQKIKFYSIDEKEILDQVFSELDDALEKNCGKYLIEKKIEDLMN